MKQVTLFLIIFLLNGEISLAQNKKEPEHCATMERLHLDQINFPESIQRMQKIEEFAQNYILAHKGDGNQVNEINNTVLYRIPVVVHVVYNPNFPEQNISDAQVQSQINVLNEDFKRANADKINTPSAFSSVASSCLIEFVLANNDPSCNPSSGIVRKATSAANFEQSTQNIYNSSQGGDNIWPSLDYLNIYCCNLATNLLGYANFPGQGSSATDGVVIGYKYFGRAPANPFASNFNLGRTGTHEVGHWLNLKHIWGDAFCGNDLVSDTPVQEKSNTNCPSFPHQTCLNGANGDMFMNYMDYTNDNCMNMFTVGQSNRARLTLTTGGARNNVTNSHALNPNPIIFSIVSTVSNSATVYFTNFQDPGTYTIFWRAVGSATWNSTTSLVSFKTIVGLISGTTYEFRVRAQKSCLSNISTFTIPASTCQDPNENNNMQANAKSAALNVENIGVICPVGDIDWFKFQISGNKCFKVVATGGVGISVYNSNNAQIDEITNYAPSGTYYVQVVATSTSNYTLNQFC